MRETNDRVDMAYLRKLAHVLHDRILHLHQRLVDQRLHLATQVELVGDLYRLLLRCHFAQPLRHAAQR